MTERRRATLVTRMRDARNMPGAYKFTYNCDGIIFICPCGCKAMLHLNFDTGDGQSSPVWKWDGNVETPTLSPSIHLIDHWHGCLVRGEFIKIA